MNIEYVDPPVRTEPVTKPLITEKPAPTLLNRAQRRSLQRYIAHKARTQMAEVKRRKPWMRDAARMRCPRCHLLYLGNAADRCQCQVQSKHRCMMCHAEFIASQQAYRWTCVCAACGTALQGQWDNEEASRAAAYERAEELRRIDAEEIGEAEMASLLDEIGEEYDEALSALADL